MRACVSVSIRLDYRKALERYKPAVVVCSWMPWEHDWTGEAGGWVVTGPLLHRMASLRAS